MPLKKKQQFLSLQEQEKGRQDFIENIADDEETLFDNDVSLKGLDVDNKILAPVSKSESEGDDGAGEYE